MTNIQTLLTEAKEGSRELSDRIAVAAGWSWTPSKYRSLVDGENIKNWVSPEGYRGEPPDFSQSLDAALPGENIVEVYLSPVIEGEPLGEIWEAWHLAEDGARYSAQANTEALARRLAALKAREAGDG